MTLNVESVSKKLGDFSLNNISFVVKTGEYFMLLGPTGAGKTIVLETIAGIHTPDSGRILWDGEDLTDHEPKDRNIAVVYQDYMLFPHLTVADNIGFGLRQRGENKTEMQPAVEKMAGLLGIVPLLKRYPGTLSGGEQQRVALARALILKPRVLLLDEPMNALDTAMREYMRKELSRIHRITGTTVIQITHHFEDVFALADRIAIMREGRIVQAGDPADVFWHPNDTFVAGFVGIGNLIKGISRKAGSIVGIAVTDTVSIMAASDITGPVIAMLHAEDIIVSSAPFTSSARNCLPGTVTAIESQGTTVKIQIDAGFPVSALLTCESCRELELSVGSAVYATFKASAVHVISR
ncbi:MAG: ATP-binding cassette domain-containing protein [Methanoregula sp.]|jgi:molybdopterin-binding protein